MTEKFYDRWPKNESDAARRHRESFALLAEKQGERDKSMRAFEANLRNSADELRASKGLPVSPRRERDYDWVAVAMLVFTAVASVTAVICAWIFMAS